MWQLGKPSLSLLLLLPTKTNFKIVKIKKLKIFYEIKLLYSERISLPVSIITRTAFYSHFRGYSKCIGYYESFCQTCYTMLHTHCSDKLACFLFKIFFITNQLLTSRLHIYKFNFEFEIKQINAINWFWEIVTLVVFTKSVGHHFCKCWKLIR